MNGSNRLVFPMRYRLRTLLMAFAVAIPLAWLILWLLAMLAVKIQWMLNPFWPDF